MREPLSRHADWEARLVEYLRPIMSTPFAYGRNDCALFVAGAIQAMTGADLARGFRGYRSLAAGQRILSDKGFSDHVALAAALLEEVPPSMAQAGDVAVVSTDEGPALGLVQGECIYLLRRDGVGLLSILSAERAFRV